MAAAFVRTALPISVLIEPFYVRLDKTLSCCPRFRIRERENRIDRTRRTGGVDERTIGPRVWRPFRHDRILE